MTETSTLACLCLPDSVHVHLLIQNLRVKLDSILLNLARAGKGAYWKGEEGSNKQEEEVYLPTS